MAEIDYPECTRCAGPRNLGRLPGGRPDGSVVTGHARWDVERFGLPAAEIELRAYFERLGGVDGCGEVEKSLCQLAGGFHGHVVAHAVE
jgi:hypothetical protein